MVTVFFDHEGIILLDFLEKGKTINSDYYCNLLQRMREQLWRKPTWENGAAPNTSSRQRPPTCVKALLGDNC